MRRAIRQGTVNLRYLMTVQRAGKVYHYVRIKGHPLVAMPEAPLDSPKFLKAYADAIDAAGKGEKPIGGTIRAMIIAYLGSDQFRALSAAYRHVLRRECDEITAQAQNAMASHLRDEHIRADLAALDPHKSRARQKAWRQLCGWALTAGYLSMDPSAGIKRKAIPKSDGHLPWTDDDIDRYRARWPIGSVPRAAMELMLWTGARISDAVLIGSGMIDRQGVLVFRQHKTGDMAYVPWTCALPAYAVGLEPDRAIMHESIAPLAGHPTFLATSQGGTRSSKALGTLIITSAKEAGVSKSAHGLRKTRAVMLAEAGATSHQIAAWTGHHSLSEVEHYTRSMSRKSAVMGA